MKRASLNALRVLATVAQTRSFKGAAQNLGVTQSAVSRQVQALEEQLGVRLIQRDNRMHALTDTGSLLAPELQRIFSQLDELISSVQQSKASDIRTLRLAIHENCLQTFLQPRLDDFHALYPHLRLEVCQADEFLTPQAEDSWRAALEAGDIDVLVAVGNVRGKHIVQSPLVELEWSVYGKPQTPLFVVESSTDSKRMDEAAEQTGLNNKPSAEPWQPPKQLKSAATTSQALLLAQMEHAQALVPHYYEPSSGGPCVLAGSLTAQHLRLPSTHQLQSFHAKQREHELAVVAFTNWLRHVATL